MIFEFYKYQGLYDGIGSDHLYHGNEGKYWQIFYEEQEKIYAKQREDWNRKLRRSKVTTGHKPNKSKNPIKKRIYRG